MLQVLPLHVAASKVADEAKRTGAKRIYNMAKRVERDIYAPQKEKKAIAQFAREWGIAYVEGH
ncbi:MAG: hypothetical protein HC888_12260 [Candidatus Competibacteraceae bacterium]|nr:hypothetical protein [Candidatus Competibacteraceae bacterium]